MGIFFFLSSSVRTFSLIIYGIGEFFMPTYTIPPQKFRFSFCSLPPVFSFLSTLLHMNKFLLIRNIFHPPDRHHPFCFITIYNSFFIPFSGNISPSSLIKSFGNESRMPNARCRRASRGVSFKGMLYGTTIYLKTF